MKRGLTFEEGSKSVGGECCVSFLWDTNPIAVYKRVSGDYI